MAILEKRIETFAIASLIIALGTAVACTQAPDRDKNSWMAATAQPEGPILPALPFDRILLYDEMPRLLQGWVAVRPAIMEVHSIGHTPGGRELWFVTITNLATGPAAEGDPG